ncbi:hypothetical protein E4U21_006593 [Claviceps maximensis]|nr:hypothetical protein E4U21_006593 [Claviceps maximensis]
MQFLNLILAVAAATASAAAVEKRLNFGKFCSPAILDTEGICEDQGFKGYCCNNDQGGVFTQNVNIALDAKAECTSGGQSGHAYCA